MTPAGEAPHAALFDHIPALVGRLGWTPLGAWPTPVERWRAGGVPLWIKREDLSAPGYAGNKIRPLEIVFGQALRSGRRRVFATGAYGSNHALATVVQAPRAGLEAGAILWPQPATATARANLCATLSSGASLRFIRSVTQLPAAIAWRRLAHGATDWVMPPGAATPLGALGHASAALELAAQLAAAGEPTPRTIALPCGSTCTTVGLLVGVAVARAVGLWPASRPLPVVHAVRVTPWPVTSPLRIARMAVRTLRLLAELGGPRLRPRVGQVLARLVVARGYLGRGYGRPTEAGLDAVLDAGSRGLRLDTTYSAKAAAYLADHLERLPRPIVFWSTKSSVPLPAADPAAVAAAPAAVRRWLAAPRIVRGVALS